MTTLLNTRGKLTGWQDRISGGLIVVGVIACGLLLAAVVAQTIPYGLGQITALPAAPNPQAVAQTALDPAYLQLVERVRDTTSFLDITVKLIGVLATALGLALGLSIWKTSEHATALVTDRFLRLKADQLEPAVEASKKELTGLSNEGTLLILGETELLLDNLFREFILMYKRLLEQKGVVGDALEDLLRNEDESFRTNRDITKYLIASLSRNEDTVITQCHNLLALLTRKDFEARADGVLAHLSNLLGVWGEGSRARSEIRSLYDAIPRRSRHIA